MEIRTEVGITVEALCGKCVEWFVLKQTKEGSSIWKGKCQGCDEKVAVQICLKR